MRRAIPVAVFALSIVVASSARADDPPSSPPPSAAPAPATPPPARAAGHGIAIVALGEGSADAARALAREVYADAALRAPIDEKTAQILCGAPAGADDVRGRDLADLRASMDPDTASATTRRALESLAAELGARAVLAVSRPAGASGPRARIVAVGGAGDAGVELAGLDAGGSGTWSWPGATAALRSLFPSSAPPTSPPVAPAQRRPTAPGQPAEGKPGGKAEGKPGARRDGTIAAPSDAAAVVEDAFYERPWFWVALGAFTAAGVTALVVSQTGADEPSDSVRFRATIPQATFSFP